MEVKAHRSTDLVWTGYDNSGKPWFESDISIFDFSAIKTTDKAVSDKLQKILKKVIRFNCEFLDKWNAFKIDTHLEFPRDWGLGSSSTLIYLVAKWADIEPMELYFACENGSGYDVAIAGSKYPLEYWCTPDNISYTKSDFNPKYKDQLYFVHLGKKQSSEDSIKDYLKNVKGKDDLVKGIGEITEAIQEASDISSFEKLMEQHEDLISKHTGFTKVSDHIFQDYNFGKVKSLGAWGGDFVMATSDQDAATTTNYFKSKGLNTILAYSEMAL